MGFWQAMTRGFNEINLISDIPRYRFMTKTTKCNAQGFLSFKNVVDGDYFVTTTVLWMINYNPQGGSLLKKA